MNQSYVEFDYDSEEFLENMHFLTENYVEFDYDPEEFL